MFRKKKKSHSDELFLIVPPKVQISPLFFNYLLDPNSIFSGRRNLYRDIFRKGQQPPLDADGERQHGHKRICSKPGWDSVSLHWCAGSLGSRFLYNAYKHVLECGAILVLFAESRTVFFLKSSDVDNNGRIVRSPEALRPLTLCNCDFQDFHHSDLSRPSMVHHEMHAPLAKMYLLQTNDG